MTTWKEAAERYRRKHERDAEEKKRQVDAFEKAVRGLESFLASEAWQYAKLLLLWSSQRIYIYNSLRPVESLSISSLGLLDQTMGQTLVTDDVRAFVAKCMQKSEYKPDQLMPMILQKLDEIAEQAPPA